MLGNKFNIVVIMSRALLRRYQMKQISPWMFQKTHPPGVQFRFHFNNKEIKPQGETHCHEMDSNVYSQTFRKKQNKKK